MTTLQPWPPRPHEISDFPDLDASALLDGNVLIRDAANDRFIGLPQPRLAGLEQSEWERVRSLFPLGERVGIGRQRSHVVGASDFYELIWRVGELYGRVTLETPLGLPGGANLVHQHHTVEMCRAMVLEPAVTSAGYRPVSPYVATAGAWSNTADAMADNGRYLESDGTGGATATFTVPVGERVIGWSGPIRADGGLSSVSVDGSLTRATCLPTAQDLVNRGDLAAANLTTNGGTILPTTRILSHYSRDRGFDTTSQRREHAVLVDDPDQTVTHTVVVTELGIRTPAAGNTGNKIFFAGFTRSGDTTTLDTPGADLYRWRGIFTQKESAQEYAKRVTPVLGDPQVTCGCVHGFEVQNSLATYIDGLPVTLANGDRVWGNHIAVVKSSTIAPDNFVGNVFDVTTTYSMRTGGPLVESVTVNPLQNGYYAFDDQMQTLDGWTFTRARSASSTVDLDIVSAANDTEQGPFPDYWAVSWNKAGGELAAFNVEPRGVDSFSHPPGGLSVLDAASTNGSKTAKWYARRAAGAGTPIPFTAGIRERSRMRHFYGYLPNVHELVSYSQS